MTADEFRKLALGFPEAIEASHMGHPDFRVRGKIFATLGPGEAWGMVKLAPDDQASFADAEPEVFEVWKGGWGKGGATKVHLARAKKTTVKKALVAAWRNTAPKRLVAEYDAS